MRLALLFSGQGGQRPEHLQRLRQEAPVDLATAVASALPGVWPKADPDPEEIAANQVAQPLIFALEMTRWAQLQGALPRPVCAAGYSLGEMAAVSAAGAFSPVPGVDLCRQRARLMDEAAGGESGMLAILGLDDSVVADIAGACGLAIAIRNGPRHLVVAGSRSALAAAEALAEGRGATRTVRLAVHTPSHTPALAAAAEGFARCLEGIPDGRLAFPVLSAIDGSAARTRRQALAALSRQICTPLDWATCMANLVELQPDAVLEIGPGNALSRLLAELAPDIPVRACDDFRGTAGILAWLNTFA